MSVEPFAIALDCHREWQVDTARFDVAASAVPEPAGENFTVRVLCNIAGRYCRGWSCWVDGSGSGRESVTHAGFGAEVAGSGWVRFEFAAHELGEALLGRGGSGRGIYALSSEVIFDCTVPLDALHVGSA